MHATAFDMEAPLDERRVIIRYGSDGLEMVELPWGLRPTVAGAPSARLVRAEGRRFPTYRCLVPASEFRLIRSGHPVCFAMADGNWFYFAAIWRPAAPDWPEAYAILTVGANLDVAPYSDRQMTVIKRADRMEWLDLTCPEEELLRPLPRGTFHVERILAGKAVPSLV
jgi:putative SOS response-associated peptidase YedK